MDKTGAVVNRRGSVTCLQELKIKISECKELEEFNWVFDDRFLLHFIRGCKYDIDKAFKVLQNYISVRKKWASFFRIMIPSEVKELYKVLNHRGPKGQLIVFMRDCWWNPNELSLDDQLRSGLVNYEEVWNDIDTERNGVIGVWDTVGFNYGHFLHFTPWQMNKIANIFIKAFPMRVSAIHVLNVPVYFKMALNLGKNLLPSKLKERMFLHGKDLSTFYTHIPPSKLPIYIGGELSDQEAFRQDIFPNILKKEEFYKKFAECL